MFKEGDFDLTYRSRQLDAVIPYVFAWNTLFAAEEAVYQCKPQILTQPVMSYAYSTHLDNAKYTYQAVNLPGFAAAEAAAQAQLLVDSTAISGARQAAWNALVAAGGVYVNETDPYAPHVPFSDPATSTYLATPAGRAYRDTIELAILTGLQLATQDLFEFEITVRLRFFFLTSRLSQRCRA